MIGFDAKDLAAFDVQSGRQVWKLSPEFSGDFNVPTPVRVNDQLLFVATENNGARLIELHADCESPKTSPDACDEEFSPDSHTPVAIGNRIYGVHHGLWAFDAAEGPKLTGPGTTKTRDWTSMDFSWHPAAGCWSWRIRASWFSTKTKGPPSANSTASTCGRDHRDTVRPAFVGTRCYVRIGKELKCLELGTAP